MHSYSFQDTELKLGRKVKDYPGQVVEGLKIFGVPLGWLGHTGDNFFKMAKFA